MKRVRPGVMLALLPAWWLLSAPAWAATPVPAFPLDGVAVAGTADRYAPVRRFLAGLRSPAKARYYVAVVDRADPQGREGARYADAAIPYAETVFDAWRLHLDPQRAVVVVLGVGNQGVAVQPGSAWTRLGFERMAVRETVKESLFANHARTGDYAEALIQLIRAVDERLAVLAAREQRVRSQVPLRLVAGRARYLGVLSRFESGQVLTPELQAVLDEARSHLEKGQAAEAYGRHLEADAELTEATALLSRAEDMLDRFQWPAAWILPWLTAGAAFGAVVTGAMWIGRRAARSRQEKS